MSYITRTFYAEGEREDGTSFLSAEFNPAPMRLDFYISDLDNPDRKPLDVTIYSEETKQFIRFLNEGING